MSQPLVIVVVGASRGIGHALVGEFSKLDNVEIIGTVRKQADAKFESPKIKGVLLDLNDPQSIAEAVKEIKEVDILMVNAGMGADEPILELTEESFSNYLDVNVKGPWRVVKAFIPALKARKTRKVIFTSSQCGSLEMNYDGKIDFRGAYAVTKAAINMFALQVHLDLAKTDGFIAVPLHPGWVDTALGNPDSVAASGAIPPAESAAGMVKVVMGLKPEDSGRFFQYNGGNLPW